jgi:hypothetical protein
MAQYRVTLTLKTDGKAPRRGQREALRYQLLTLLNHEDVPQATRRSLRIRRVA